MLVASVDAKLRELAAQSDRTWIKLGSLVLPGKVKASFNPGGGGEFTIVARVSTGRVRHALLSLGNRFSRVRAEHLTWSDHSYSVQAAWGIRFKRGNDGRRRLEATMDAASVLR